MVEPHSVITYYCVRYRMSQSSTWREARFTTRTELWAWLTAMRPFIVVDREWEERA